MARSKTTARPIASTGKTATTTAAKVSKSKGSSKAQQPAKATATNKSQPAKATATNKSQPAKIKAAPSTKKPDNSKQRPVIKQPSQEQIDRARMVPDDRKTWGKVRLGYDKRGTDLTDPIPLKLLLVAQACDSHPHDDRAWLHVTSTFDYNGAEFADTAEDEPRNWTQYQPRSTERDDWLVNRSAKSADEVIFAARDYIQGRDTNQPVPLPLPIDWTIETGTYDPDVLLGSDRPIPQADRDISVTAVFKDAFSWDGKKYAYGNKYVRVQMVADWTHTEVLNKLKQELKDWYKIPRGKRSAANAAGLDTKLVKSQAYAEAGYLNLIDTLEQVDLELWVAPRLDGCTQIWNWSLAPTGNLNQWISQQLYDGTEEPAIYMEVHIVAQADDHNDPVDDNSEVIDQGDAPEQGNDDAVNDNQDDAPEPGDDGTDNGNQDDAPEPEDGGSDNGNISEPDDNVINDHETRQTSSERGPAPQDITGDADPSPSDREETPAPEQSSKAHAKSSQSASTKTTGGVAGRGVARPIKKGNKTAKPSHQDSVAAPASTRSASKRKRGSFDGIDMTENDSDDESVAQASETARSKQSKTTQAAKKRRV